MTEISFHFNVADRTDYACRMLRKAVRKGVEVVVAGPAAELARVDHALWSFEPLEFIPHVVLRAGEATTPHHRMTPVWLLEDASASGRHDVLLNLGAAPPSGFESFARVIEIVTPDESDRLAARSRWKHYAARGYAIERHEVGA